MSQAPQFGGPAAWLVAGSLALFVVGLTWISRSETGSIALENSSRMRMLGSRRIARANAIRCFSPPESMVPRSPILVS